MCEEDNSYQTKPSKYFELPMELEELELLWKAPK